jgi:hypothetical protein
VFQQQKYYFSKTSRPITGTSKKKKCCERKNTYLCAVKEMTSIIRRSDFFA